MSKFSTKIKDRFTKKENGRAHFPNENPDERVEDLENDLGIKLDREKESSPPVFERESSPLHLQMIQTPSPARFDPEPSPPPRFLGKEPSPPGRQFRDPIPTPRFPTQAEVSREALENILQSVAPNSPREPPPSPDSPPDSGISLASPNRQMITSTLFDRFSASPPRPPPQPKDKHKPKSPDKEKSKPTFSKIFGEKRQQIEEELEGPPRVRRPSREGKHYASAPISSQTQPLSIKTLTQMTETPTTLYTTTAPSAPPQTLLRPARPPPLPLSVIPTVRSFAQRQMSISQTPTSEGPSQIYLAQAPIYASTSPTSGIIYTETSRAPQGRGQPRRSSPPFIEPIQPEEIPGPTYAETPRSRPYEELGLPPPEDAPRRHGQPNTKYQIPNTSRRPVSAASAVAELLASRQPVSLRIHIQKHKTETSYKKSQTFGTSPPEGQGSSPPKKNGNGFTESSI